MKYPVSEKITTSFINNGIINSEDKDIYTYGLQQGAQIVLNIITIIVVCLYLQMFWQGIVFLLAFIPLRSYAGGIHAKTQLRCYFLSTVTFAGVLLLIKFILWTTPVCLIIAISAGIIVFIFAPVEDHNKPLDQIEIAVYKKRARYILCFLILLAFLLLCLGQLQISVCITMSITLVSVMLILGRIKNSIIK